MSESGSFDLLVVGAGPGGYVAALRGAQLGMRVGVIERRHVGGRCLNVACIPAKATLKSADALDEVRAASAYGIVTNDPVVDGSAVVTRRASVIETLTGGVRGLLSSAKVELIEGAARLGPAGRVAVGEREYESARIVLATGSVRRGLPGFPFGERVIGTEEAWSFPDIPKSLIVLGAGASGVEIASAYGRLGSTVHLVEVAPRILPGEDEDVSPVIERALRGQGVRLYTAASCDGVEERVDRVSVAINGERVEAEWLVVAAGRRPDVDGLGLAEAGVELDDSGYVRVDGHLRTSSPRIWAIGDLVPGPALAHKSSEEAICAVEDSAGLPVTPVSHERIPRAVFCAPNVASFGLTEREARESGADVAVGKAPLRAVGAGVVFGQTTGFVKIVGDRRYGEILGAHVVGRGAPELLQQLVDASELEGGYVDLARVIHSHPTLSEAVQEAVRAVEGWAIHVPS